MGVPLELAVWTSDEKPTDNLVAASRRPRPALILRWHVLRGPGEVEFSAAPHRCAGSPAERPAGFGAGLARLRLEPKKHVSLCSRCDPNLTQRQEPRAFQAYSRLNASTMKRSGNGPGLPARALTVLLGCCALAGATARAQGEGAPAGLPASAVVAVEPFDNISRNPEDAWLGVGIADTVVADLSALALAVVEGRGAVAGRDVRWVVTGGYQRLGERLRLTARLTEAASGAVVTSVRLVGSLDEVFALQDRIVAELTAGVDLHAGPARPAGGGIRDPFRPAGSDPAASGLGRSNAPPDGSGAPARNAGPGPRRPSAPAGFIEGIIMPRPSGESVGAAPAGEPGPGAPVPEERTDAALPAAAGGNAPAGMMGAPPAGFTPAAGILAGRPSVEPVRTSDRPSIDGRLDDAVWRRAARITEFVQQQPLDGEPATEETELYIAYDTQNLYFGMHVHYSDPVLIRANRSDRDQTFSDDTITLYFDPFLDQQRAYVFSVNGYGVQSDGILGM